MGAPAVNTLGRTFDALFLLLFLHALLVGDDARAALREHLGGQRPPLLDVLQTALPKRYARYGRALLHLVAERTRDGIARIAAPDVDELNGRFVREPGDDPLVSMSGPDLMATGDPATSGWLPSPRDAAPCYWFPRCRAGPSSCPAGRRRIEATPCR